MGVQAPTFSITMAATSTPLEMNELPLTLELGTIILRGKSIKRTTLCLTGVYPSSSMAFIKKQVNQLLRDPPEEVVLLMASETPIETATLADYNVVSGSKMEVLVSYPEATPFFQWEDLANVSGNNNAVPVAVMNGIDPVFEEEMDARLLQSEWRPSSVRKILQHPPPLLMQKRKNPGMDCLALREELDGIQLGKLFNIKVSCNIILGQHVHHRLCAVPAEPATKVSNVVDRLQSWLGSAPDELFLFTDHGTFEGTFESHALLKDYGIIGDAELMATAWYKNASNKDLPQRVVLGA